MKLSEFIIQGYDSEPSFVGKETVNNCSNVHLETHRIIFKKLPDQMVLVRMGDNNKFIIKSHDLHLAWQSTK